MLLIFIITNTYITINTCFKICFLIRLNCEIDEAVWKHSQKYKLQNSVGQLEIVGPVEMYIDYKIEYVGLLSSITFPSKNVVRVYIVVDILRISKYIANNN